MMIDRHNSVYKNLKQELSWNSYKNNMQHVLQFNPLLYLELSPLPYFVMTTI
jgi:hypothetical protein